MVVFSFCRWCTPTYLPVCVECLVEIPPEMQQEVSKAMVCKAINAGITAYIPTSGNGTVVDPNMLKISALKFIQTKMKAKAFISDDMPFMHFIGIRSGEPSHNTRPTTPKQQTTQPTSRKINVMGTIILCLFCTVILSIIVGIFQRYRHGKNKKKNQVKYSVEKNYELS